LNFLSRSRFHRITREKRRGDARVIDDEPDTQLLERRAVSLKDIDIDDVVDIFGEEASGGTQEDDGRVMVAGGKSEGNAKRFDWSVRLARVLCNHHGNTLSHCGLSCKGEKAIATIDDTGEHNQAGKRRAGINLFRGDTVLLAAIRADGQFGPLIEEANVAMVPDVLDALVDEVEIDFDSSTQGGSGQMSDCLNTGIRWGCG